jgi:hypothetical protein
LSGVEGKEDDLDGDESELVLDDSLDPTDDGLVDSVDFSEDNETEAII